MFDNRNNVLSLFPLLEIADDTVITTHGVYVRGFEVFGMDSEHLEIEVSTHAAQVLYEAFRMDVPEGTLLQFCVVCDRNYEDVFERFEAVPEPENPVLAHQRQRRLDYLRNSDLRRYRVYLFVGAMAGFTQKEMSRPDLETHQARVKEATELGKKVRMALERVELIKLLPLSGAQIEELFQDALRGSAKPAPRPAPPPDKGLPQNPSHDVLSCRERLLTESVGYDKDYVRLGRRFGKVLSLQALPERTRFTMMEALFHTGAADFRASINILIPPQSGWKAYLGQRRRIITGMSRRDTPAPNETIEEYASEANLLNAKLTTGSKDRVVLCSVQVAVFAPSVQALEEQADGFRQYLQSTQSGLRFVEEINAHDRELFKTLPGMAVTFDRYRHRVGCTANAVDMMPLSANAPGDDRPIFLLKNDRHELVSFDPMEPKRQNWNALLLGASGVGKSVLANMLITTAMLANLTRGRLMVVDFAGEEKSSYRNLVRNFDGAWVPILGTKVLVGLSPFPVPLAAPDPKTCACITAVDLDFVMIVTDILIANAENKDSQDALLTQGLVRRAVLELYAPSERQEAPLYRDLYAVLLSYRGRDDVDQSRLRRVIDLLLSGVLEDPNAVLLTRPSNLGTHHNFAVLDLFGVNSMMPRAREALVYTVCHLVSRAAFQDNDYEYKYVVLDEVAQLLRNPAMAQTIKELYATARKHNTSIWTVTQKYEDYVESGVAGTLAVNSDTKILMSHQNAKTMEDLVIQHFTLKPRIAHLFRQLRTKKGVASQALLLTKVYDRALREGRDIAAVLNVELSPFDYQLATSDPADRKQQNLYIEANPHLPVYKVLDYLAYDLPQRIQA